MDEAAGGGQPLFRQALPSLRTSAPHTAPESASPAFLREQALRKVTRSLLLDSFPPSLQAEQISVDPLSLTETNIKKGVWKDSNRTLLVRGLSTEAL